MPTKFLLKMGEEEMQDLSEEITNAIKKGLEHKSKIMDFDLERYIKGATLGCLYGAAYMPPKKLDEVIEQILGPGWSEEDEFAMGVKEGYRECLWEAYQ